MRIEPKTKSGTYLLIFSKDEMKQMFSDYNESGPKDMGYAIVHENEAKLESGNYAMRSLKQRTEYDIV